MHLFDCSFVNYVSVKLITVFLDGVKFCLLFLIGCFKPEQAAMWTRPLWKFDWLIELFFQDCSCDLVNVMLSEEQPKTYISWFNPHIFRNDRTQSIQAWSQSQWKPAKPALVSRLICLNQWDRKNSCPPGPLRDLPGPCRQCNCSPVVAVCLWSVLI